VDCWFNEINERSHPHNSRVGHPAGFVIEVAGKFLRDGGWVNCFGIQS
jgi:hypothetical protein